MEIKEYITRKNQFELFDNEFLSHKKATSRKYSNVITVIQNYKGVLDVDTVKGCSAGMKAYPTAGCYKECYAYKQAVRFGIDFTTSVSRQFMGREHKGTIEKLMNQSNATWYRIGTAGDPCHDWKHTIAVINALWHTHKTPVIITKHWYTLTDEQIQKLLRFRVVINTSVSGLDTDEELSHRVLQLKRLRSAGIKSVCRVVTCDYGNTEFGKLCKEKQDYLLSLLPIIDNPLRARKSNYYVLNGDVILKKYDKAIGGGKYVSMHDENVFIEKCKECPDQCGVDRSLLTNKGKNGECYEGRTRSFI